LKKVSEEKLNYYINKHQVLEYVDRIGMYVIEQLILLSLISFDVCVQ